MDELTGRGCLVTGGSRGIGRAIALELGRHGASVAVGYANNAGRGRGGCRRDRDVTEGKSFVFGCDVQDPAAIEPAVASVLERFGKIDVLVNNAGITRDRSLAKMSPRGVGRRPPDEPEQRLPPDLAGVAAHGPGRLWPNRQHQLRDRPPWQFRPGQLRGGEGGIIGFTKSAALELARKGVTVNAIAPGFIETEMIAAMPDEVRARILEKIPMGRFGRPEEIAQAVAFLVSHGRLRHRPGDRDRWRDVHVGRLCPAAPVTAGDRPGTEGSEERHDG